MIFYSFIIHIELIECKNLNFDILFYLFIYFHARYSFEFKLCWFLRDDAGTLPYVVSRNNFFFTGVYINFPISPTCHYQIFQN